MLADRKRYLKKRAIAGLPEMEAAIVNFFFLPDEN
jgi:hypothetical protein